MGYRYWCKLTVENDLVFAENCILLMKALNIYRLWTKSEFSQKKIPFYKKGFNHNYRKQLLVTSTYKSVLCVSLTG